MVKIYSPPRSNFLKLGNIWLDLAQIYLNPVILGLIQLQSTQIQRCLMKSSSASTQINIDLFSFIHITLY